MSSHSFPFRCNEVVLAEWGKRVFYAKILSMDFHKRTCQLLFDDNSKDEVEFSRIHSVNETTAEIVCVVCKDDSTTADNEIVLCDICSVGFHQRCHVPSIPDRALEYATPWTCCYCMLNRANPHIAINPFEHREIRHKEDVRRKGEKQLGEITADKGAEKENSAKEENQEDTGDSSIMRPQSSDLKPDTLGNERLFEESHKAKRLNNVMDKWKNSKVNRDEDQPEQEKMSNDDVSISNEGERRISEPQNVFISRQKDGVFDEQARNLRISSDSHCVDVDGRNATEKCNGRADLGEGGKSLKSDHVNAKLKKKKEETVESRVCGQLIFKAQQYNNNLEFENLDFNSNGTERLNRERPGNTMDYSHKAADNGAIVTVDGVSKQRETVNRHRFGFFKAQATAKEADKEEMALAKHPSSVSELQYTKLHDKVDKIAMLERRRMVFKKSRQRRLDSDGDVCVNRKRMSKSLECGMNGGPRDKVEQNDSLHQTESAFRSVQKGRFCSRPGSLDKHKLQLNVNYRSSAPIGLCSKSDYVLHCKHSDAKADSVDDNGEFVTRGSECATKINGVVNGSDVEEVTGSRSGYRSPSVGMKRAIHCDSRGNELEGRGGITGLEKRVDGIDKCRTEEDVDTKRHDDSSDDFDIDLVIDVDEEEDDFGVVKKRTKLSSERSDVLGMSNRRGIINPVTGKRVQKDVAFSLPENTTVASSVLKDNLLVTDNSSAKAVEGSDSFNVNGDNKSRFCEKDAASTRESTGDLIVEAGGGDSCFMGIRIAEVYSLREKSHDVQKSGMEKEVLKESVLNDEQRNVFDMLKSKQREAGKELSSSDGERTEAHCQQPRVSVQAEGISWHRSFEEKNTAKGQRSPEGHRSQQRQRVDCRPSQEQSSSKDQKTNQEQMLSHNRMTSQGMGSPQEQRPSEDESPLQEQGSSPEQIPLKDNESTGETIETGKQEIQANQSSAIGTGDQRKSPVQDRASDRCKTSSSCRRRTSKETQAEPVTFKTAIDRLAFDLPGHNWLVERLLNENKIEMENVEVSPQKLVTAKADDGQHKGKKTKRKVKAAKWSKINGEKSEKQIDANNVCGDHEKSVNLNETKCNGDFDESQRVNDDSVEAPNDGSLEKGGLDETETPVKNHSADQSDLFIDCSKDNNLSPVSVTSSVRKDRSNSSSSSMSGEISTVFNGNDDAVAFENLEIIEESCSDVTLKSNVKEVSGEGKETADTCAAQEPSEGKTASKHCDENKGSTAVESRESCDEHDTDDQAFLELETGSLKDEPQEGANRSIIANGAEEENVGEMRKLEKDTMSKEKGNDVDGDRSLSMDSSSNGNLSKECYLPRVVSRRPLSNTLDSNSIEPPPKLRRFSLSEDKNKGNESPHSIVAHPSDPVRLDVTSAKRSLMSLSPRTRTKPDQRLSPMNEQPIEILDVDGVDKTVCSKAEKTTSIPKEDIYIDLTDKKYLKKAYNDLPSVSVNSLMSKVGQCGTYYDVQKSTTMKGQLEYNSLMFEEANMISSDKLRTSMEISLPLHAHATNCSARKSCMDKRPAVFASHAVQQFRNPDRSVALHSVHFHHHDHHIHTPCLHGDSPNLNPNLNPTVNGNVNMNINPNFNPNFDADLNSTLKANLRVNLSSGVSGDLYRNGYLKKDSCKTREPRMNPNRWLERDSFAAKLSPSAEKDTYLMQSRAEEAHKVKLKMFGGSEIKEVKSQQQKLICEARQKSPVMSVIQPHPVVMNQFNPVINQFSHAVHIPQRVATAPANDAMANGGIRNLCPEPQIPCPSEPVKFASRSEVRNVSMYQAVKEKSSEVDKGMDCQNKSTSDARNDILNRILYDQSVSDTTKKELIEFVSRSSDKRASPCDNQGNIQPRSKSPRVEIGSGKNTNYQVTTPNRPRNFAECNELPSVQAKLPPRYNGESSVSIGFDASPLQGNVGSGNLTNAGSFVGIHEAATRADGQFYAKPQQIARRTSVPLQRGDRASSVSNALLNLAYVGKETATLRNENGKVTISPEDALPIYRPHKLNELLPNAPSSIAQNNTVSFNHKDGMSVSSVASPMMRNDIINRPNVLTGNGNGKAIGNCSEAALLNPMPHMTSMERLKMLGELQATVRICEAEKWYIRDRNLLGRKKFVRAVEK
eukprot:gene13876-15324_t